MKTKIKKLTLAAAALLALTTVSTLALTVPVAEDTYSTSTGKLTPGTGSATSMAVNAKQTAFVRFNLSDPAVVPTAIVPGNIVSATLRLFVESARNPGDLTVHAVTSAWTENPGAASAPEPTIDAAVIGTIPAAALQRARFVSVDVTAAVQAALDVNDFGFAIQTTSGNTKILLGTKEGPGLGYAAELEIEANLAGSTAGDLSAASLTVSGTITAGAATIAGGLGADSATIVGALSADSVTIAHGLGVDNLTLIDNLMLPATTGTTGIIYAGATPLLHDFGINNFFAGKDAGNLTMSGLGNTALGFQAMAFNTTGSYNAAVGFQALQGNLGGIFNTATGYLALSANTSGFSNTATGAGALLANTTGYQNTAGSDDALAANINGNNNTASGYASLFLNQSGSNNTATGFATLYSNAADNNTATGYSALYSNTGGTNNVAEGYQALYSNKNGGSNTACGVNALYTNFNGQENVAGGTNALFSNITGSGNCGIGFQTLFTNNTGSNNCGLGFQALLLNTTGASNCGVGYEALFSNTTGTNNTAIGASALSSNMIGDFNIAIGAGAGSQTTGGNNICIGHPGDPGNDVMHLGQTQTQTFIAGVYGATSGFDIGAPVSVTTTGRLFTVGSSQRFKDSIQSMDEASDVLLQLRPVTFRYKPAYGPPNVPQFGLIAEEVNAVCSDLVARDAKGVIYTVRYDAVNAMLLNEFLKEHRRVEDQEQRLAEQRKQMSVLTTRLEELERRLGKIAPAAAGQ